MDTFEIRCLSYNNPERKERMTKRFEAVGLPVIWGIPVPPGDPRIPSNSNSCMFGHLDMIKSFLDGSAEFGIFCEDDVYLRRDLKTSIQIAIDGYKRIKPDIMLLGYLANYKAATWCIHNHHPVEPPFTFLSVYHDLWGAQMYMCDRRSAQAIWDQFHDPLTISGPFSIDWTFTKFGKSVAIYPMLAVEEGFIVGDHLGQIEFHRKCCEENYDKNIHV